MKFALHLRDEQWKSSGILSKSNSKILFNFPLTTYFLWLRFYLYEFILHHPKVFMFLLRVTRIVKMLLQLVNIVIEMYREIWTEKKFFYSFLLRNLLSVQKKVVKTKIDVQKRVFVVKRRATWRWKALMSYFKMNFLI